MPAVFFHRPTAESLDRLGPLRRFLQVWTPVLIGVAIIVTESQPTFSAANTSSWLRPIWEHLFGPISTAAWEDLHHYLRKSGHFFYYGMLCVLFLRAWLLTLARNPNLRTIVWRWRSWLLGVASTFAVASGDELHQSFLPSRTGMFSDVVLDTCGGIVLSSLVLLISWCLRRIFISRSSGCPTSRF
jgi:VanZ family protein